MAETLAKDAESAFDFFLEAYGPKYDKAAACPWPRTSVSVLPD